MKLIVLALLPSCALLSSPDDIVAGDTGGDGTTDVVDTGGDTGVDTDTDTDTDTVTDTDTDTTETDTDTDTPTEPEIKPVDGPYSMTFEGFTENGCQMNMGGISVGDELGVFEFSPKPDGVSFFDGDKEYGCDWVDGSTVEFFCEIEEADQTSTVDGFRDAVVHQDIDYEGEWVANDKIGSLVTMAQYCEGVGCQNLIDSGKMGEDFPCTTAYKMGGALIE